MKVTVNRTKLLTLVEEVKDTSSQLENEFMSCEEKAGAYKISLLYFAIKLELLLNGIK